MISSISIDLQHFNRSLALGHERDCTGTDNLVCITDF